LGPASGLPLDLDAEVMDVRKDAVMTFGAEWRFGLGDTAWIRAAGIDAVLCSLRVQMYDPSGFSHIGLDPSTRNVLVVKSSNHFQAAFEPLASEIHWVSTPGAIDFDFKRLAYKHLRRPMYPRVADPFAEKP
jgi:microcystin degradation protein MlrC